MLRKSKRPYTDRTPRVRWQGALRRMNRPDLVAYLPRGIELEEDSVEAALVAAGVEDITITEILEAHDRWQEESPDDPNGIHDAVDKTLAEKRAKKVDVG